MICMYSQGRIVGRCLSTAKCGQVYSLLNYPAYSKNNVLPKELSKQNSVKCLSHGLVYVSQTANTIPSDVPSNRTGGIKD